jgi:outer membrane protein assembly factor BamB
VTSGTTVMGPRGEILSYSIQGTGANRRLVMWNSSLAITGLISDTWSPTYLGIINGARGVQWNASIPNLPGSPAISLIGEGYIFMTYVDETAYPPVYEDMAFPATLNRDGAGNYPDSVNYIWFVNRTNLETHFPTVTRNILNGVYARWDQAKMVTHGYSISTGQEIWVTDPVPMGWGLFNQGLQLAYGKLYWASYDGHLRAYNANNGTLAWDYYMGNAGFENAYGTWPTYGFTVADHKIYITNDEHSPDAVPWRGGKLTVLNTETGKLVWAIDGRLRHTTIADGIATAFNLYDNQIYTFGKGPSKTTVSAPSTGVVTGRSIAITGTITDQTPASKDTPAISEASMGDWMAYLHMQKEIPANATGVPIKIMATNPDGTVTTLGSVTSEISGTFGFKWTPTGAGMYKITAVFEGSNSYDSSYADTFVVVDSAPSASPVITATPAPTATTPATAIPTPSVTSTPSPATNPTGGPDTAIYVAIAAAVVIICIAAAAVLLRRRK